MKRVVMENNLILTPETDIVSSRVKELVKSAKTHMDESDNYDKVVLDLGKVKVIDSIGITFIIGLYKSAGTSGKSFKVSSLNSDIKNLFAIMKLDQLFEIETT